MEKTLANIIGWILLPIYWIRYPGVNVGGGCLIDIFTVKLAKNVRICSNCWIGPNVTVNEYSILGRDARISNISIGKFTSIGSNFKVLPYGHNYKRFSTYPFTLLVKNQDKQSQKKKEKVYYGYTIIENDVWIGDNTSVIGKSVIKNGAVIGAHALVKGSLKQFGIYIGVPARFIKFRFSKGKIKRYTRNSWYDKPIDEIISMAIKS